MGRASMKRRKDLYRHIHDWDNLVLAYHKARKSKRGKPNVATFELNWEQHLLRLEAELASGLWQPGPYHAFWIHDPKKRLISAAPFPDRIVHHAVCQVIEPLFEPAFIFDSYACRPRSVGFQPAALTATEAVPDRAAGWKPTLRGVVHVKGTHAAVDRYTEFSRKNRYVLKCDVRRFFPSIDHQLLLELLARKIGCRRTLELLSLIVTSSNPQEQVVQYFPGDDLFTPHERRRGLPIGNLTSQFFANVYLNPFDHFVKEELGCRCYIRYCDDFVIFGDDKRELGRTAERLADRLSAVRLKLHERKCQVRRVDEGVDFLGYRIWPTHRRLRRESVLRFKRRRRVLRKAWRAGDTELANVRASMASWVGHAKHADTWRLREALANFAWGGRQQDDHGLPEV